MPKIVYRLGTRRSALALTQSRLIQTSLKTYGVDCELVEIESTGDHQTAHPLYQMEDTTPGVFTKQLEDALLEERIDLAVHSLKDLPTRLPPGLKVAAVPKRESTRDVLVFSKAHADSQAPMGLKKGTLIGTSSLRREAQLWFHDPHLKFHPIRGNVPTRIDKVRRGEYGGTILAEAGLNRLGIKQSDLVFVPLEIEKFVPAPGQGALAIETRQELSGPLKDALEKLNDPKAAQETTVERRVLQGLDGGCTLPLGVSCRFDHTTKLLKVIAFLGLEKPGATAGDRWAGAEYFDNSDADEQNLVARAVAYFKSR